MLRRTQSSLIFKATSLSLPRYGRREKDVETGEKSRTQIHNALYFNDEFSPSSVIDYDPFGFNINQDIWRFINFNSQDKANPKEASEMTSQRHACLFPVDWNPVRKDKFLQLTQKLVGADGQFVPDPVLLVGAAMNSVDEQFNIGGTMMDRSEALFQALEIFIRAKEPIPPALWFAIGLTIPFMDGIVDSNQKRKYPVDCLKNAWLFRQSGHTCSAFEDEPGALFLAHLGRALVLQEFLDFNLPLEARKKMLQSQGKTSEEIHQILSEVIQQQGISLEQQDVPVVELPTIEHHATFKVLLTKYDALSVFEKAVKDLAPHPVDSKDGPRNYWVNLFTSKTVIKDENNAGRLRASIFRGAATLLEMRAARGMLWAGRKQSDPDSAESDKLQRDFETQLKLTHTSEGVDAYLGRRRKFKNFRGNGELLGSSDLREYAEYQILDPEKEEFVQHNIEKRYSPEQDTSEWQPNPLKSPFTNFTK